MKKKKATVKPTNPPVKKEGRLSKIVKVIKHKWNSMLYWLMFKNIDDK
jgi:hypothetical protein